MTWPSMIAMAIIAFAAVAMLANGVILGQRRVQVASSDAAETGRVIARRAP